MKSDNWLFNSSKRWQHWVEKSSFSGEMVEGLLIDPEVTSLEGKLESFFGTVSTRARKYMGQYRKGTWSPESISF